ncbi:MAG: hypothetical protein V7641_4649 [Blastocatellia bacterium]
MRTVSLVSLMVVLMVSVSVSAQKRVQPKPVPPPDVQFDHKIVVEDDTTGNFLVIDPLSGKYEFHRCSDGLLLGGTGVVSVKGCAISFEDLTPGRRVLASIDECTQQAKASVQTFAPIDKATDVWATTDVLTVKEGLGDIDMRDNTMTCVPKKQ